MSNSSYCWVNRVRNRTKPIQVSILAELEQAIVAGELQAGDQLPRQRELAEQLGVDLTTVARAYSTARVQGLVVGARGRGTYVAEAPLAQQVEVFDLSTSAPPAPQGMNLESMVSETTALVLKKNDGATLMGYRHVTAADRAAGVRWLSRYAEAISPDHLLVASGGHSALTATLSTICTQGQTIIVDPLIYAGVIAIANRLGIKLLPCPTDAQGLEPAALEKLCATAKPAAILVSPTMHNPTTVDMPSSRRKAVAEIAAKADVWIVENDPFAPLKPSGPEPLIALAPERTFHIATLSKCVSPGFRIAYVVTPPGMEHRVAESMRAFDLMTSPLMRAIVTRWIQEGVADDVLNGVREEAMIRRSMAASILPEGQGGPESLHIWLPIAHRGEAERLRLAGRDRGLSFLTASSFAVGDTYPDGIRLCLGQIETRTTLERALRAFELLSGFHPAPPVI